MTDLPHRLDRTLFIKAPRSVVFRFFTDPQRWAGWWGEGSTIDAQLGGAVLIRYPGGIEVQGVVLELQADERIVFSYGYASGKPIPVGSSRVTITLEEASGGTRLVLRHDFQEASARDQHAQGWRYQLALFANAVANDLHQGAEATVDQWFAAWSNSDADARATTLAAITSPGVRFADRFGAVDGLEELFVHIAAVHAFMSGTRVERDGPVRHCQGKVLADWKAAPAGGHPAARGTNLFLLSAEGKIEDVTGFWT
jgi:uncharacterized protein YndB with AHSA1/START domain